ncbi:MAG: hypothetical protein ACN6OP_14650 [Pseudomonadales bacterium]
MFIGHYAVPFVVKAIRPAVPLWLLLAAAQLLDIVWAVLVLLGVERVRVVGGATMADLLHFDFMPYSHSLVAALAWSALAFILARWILDGPHRTSSAALVALVVLSHWVLDWVVHVGDLPLTGEDQKVGLGLWQHTSVSMALEIGGVALTILLWFHRMGPSALAARGSAIALMATLTFNQLFVFFGPLFPALVVATLALAVFVSIPACGHRTDRRVAEACGAQRGGV